MSKIKETFKELKSRDEGALIGYLTMGDPTITESERLIRCLCEHIDILELGIPFTDPIADGPTIQAAIERSLGAGMNTDIAFEMVGRLRKDINIPFVFMTYYNIVLQYGEERFIKKCAQVGVDGVLISDLPLEESESVLDYCKNHGVDLIFLIAPTTTDERADLISKTAMGFVYLVALLGVTGVREQLEEETAEKTRWALEHTSLPLAVGFGISKKEHVRAVLDAGASGVVVGSAFVRIVAEKADACADIKALAEDLKEGTR